MKQFALKFSAIALTVLASTPSYAGFIVDSNPSGVNLYNGSANSNVTSFTANVGQGGPAISVTTIGSTKTGSGFAIIKPDGDSLLTQVTFTPLDPTLYSAINFRGQLESTGFDGIVKLSVLDVNNITYDFTFAGLAGPNSDFASIGVISDDGDTIQSATISADTGESFKTVKQVQFIDPPPTRVPEPFTLSLFATGLAGAAALRRRKQQTA